MKQRVKIYTAWATPWLCLIGLFSLLSLLHELGYLQFLELATYDLLVITSTHNSAWKPPIAIIKVGETDIQKLGNWPLTDDQLTTTLEKLLATGPRLIGVDIYRDLAVPPGTERLQALLLKQPNVLMIEKFPSATSQGIRPPKVLAGTDRVGFSDLTIDPGGVIRRNLLFQTIETPNYRAGYSISIRLALAYLAKAGIYPQASIDNPDWLRLGHTTLKPLVGHECGYIDVDSGGYQIMLDYIGGYNPFPIYALSDVLNDRIQADKLRDQILIIGEDSDGVKDRFNTPYTILNGQQTAGSVIHAYALRQLLEIALYNRPPIRSWEHISEHLWILVWIGLGLLVGWRAISSWQLTLSMILGSLILILSGVLAFYYGWWIPLLLPMLGWQGAIGLSTVLRSGQRRHEQQTLMRLFACQVSPQVAETIWAHRDEVLIDGCIRPQVLPATILFSDLQGFTKISETMAPEPFLNWLNRYLGAMTDVIMHYGGILDDYAGDGIKANFGVPLARINQQQIAHDARQAVACALAMGQELNRLNRESKAQGFPGVGMRIGIHSGSVVVGTIGSSMRMKYTTVGSAVNLASRLESIKELPGPDIDDESTSYRILISAETANLLDDTYQLANQGRFQLRGIQHETDIFSVCLRI